jgi:hypothetical protein
MADADRLAALVTMSAELLQAVPPRSDPARIGAELERLNRSVRDLARGRVGPFDQPADFAATLLRHADPANG